MRARSTWIVVAGVALLGVAAVVEALLPPASQRTAVEASEREEAEERETDAEPETTTLPTGDRPLRIVGRRTLATELREARLGGRIVFSTDDCQRWEVRLPNLALRELEEEGCAVELSPHGDDPFGGRGVWKPTGHVVAICHADDFVSVLRLSPPQRVLRRLRGCAPAWRRDGTLTLARDGEVWAADPDCWRRSRGGVAERCTRLLLSRRELGGALRHDRSIPRDPGVIDSLQVTEMRWLDDRRLVAVLRLSIASVGFEDLLAIYDGARLVRVVPGLGRRFSQLRTSWRGSFLSVRTEQPDGLLVLLTRSGDRIPLTDVTREALGLTTLDDLRAVTWSPDERWAALASRGSIHLFRTDDESPRLIRLTLPARDVGWAPR